jgi:hypothetical protein
MASYRVLMAIAALLFLVWGASASAKDRAVDLELVLAVDISGSIDEKEALLQREGYISAILHPDILAAIKGGMLRRVAVTYVEWAGQYQNVLVGWSLLEDAASAKAFAEKLAAAQIFTSAWTSISGAIDYALPLFEKNGYSGSRQAIDISGDGPNNEGDYVVEARDRAIARGVAINGLPIVNNRPGLYGSPPHKDLDLYYRHCVIGGPGAFIVIADTHRDFARAIRKKLILEIAGRTPAPRLIKASLRKPPPCDIGEKRRTKRWGYEDDY